MWRAPDRLAGRECFSGSGRSEISRARVNVAQRTFWVARGHGPLASHSYDDGDDDVLWRDSNRAIVHPRSVAVADCLVGDVDKSTDRLVELRCCLSVWLARLSWLDPPP